MGLSLKSGLATIVAVLGLVFGTGCAATQRTVAFNEADFAKSAAGGSDVLDGSLSFHYLSVPGILERGNVVYLTPVTPYTAEWYHREVLDGQRLEPPDPRLKKYIRETNVALNGDYHFENLAAGEYYLTGTMRLHSLMQPNQLVYSDVHASVTLKEPKVYRVAPATSPIRAGDMHL
jgi:hypothetical protein